MLTNPSTSSCCKQLPRQWQPPYRLPMNPPTTTEYRVQYGGLPSHSLEMNEGSRARHSPVIVRLALLEASGFRRRNSLQVFLSPPSSASIIVWAPEDVNGLLWRERRIERHVLDDVRGGRDSATTGWSHNDIGGRTRE